MFRRLTLARFLYAKGDVGNAKRLFKSSDKVVAPSDYALRGFQSQKVLLQRLPKSKLQSPYITSYATYPINSNNMPNTETDILIFLSFIG